jgi:hypothetical protein
MDFNVTQTLEKFSLRFPLQRDWRATFSRSCGGLIELNIECVWRDTLMFYALMSYVVAKPLIPP